MIRCAQNYILDLNNNHVLKNGLKIKAPEASNRQTMHLLQFNYREGWKDKNK